MRVLVLLPKGFGTWKSRRGSLYTLGSNQTSISWPDQRRADGIGKVFLIRELLSNHLLKRSDMAWKKDVEWMKHLFFHMYMTAGYDSS